MFIGVDHGTTAIRFATPEGRGWELSREQASRLSADEIIALIREKLGPEEIEMVALSYSMGDGITRIMALREAPNRGLLRMDGAGIHVGGGTRVYEAVQASGWRAILLPGIHRDSETDPRFRVFSHGMSPEKVGLAYGVFDDYGDDFIVCDASSNTVSFVVLNGKIVAAIDAPIFAPGLMQGPIDVQSIREIDSGVMSANQAFNRGGILSKMGRSSLEECTPDEECLALSTLSLFAAMEIAALLLLCRERGSFNPGLFLAGSPAHRICGAVSELLGKRVLPLDRYSAARGCACIARDVSHGSELILGLQVDRSARSTVPVSPVPSLPPSSPHA